MVSLNSKLSCHSEETSKGIWFAQVPWACGEGLLLTYPPSRCTVNHKDLMEQACTGHTSHSHFQGRPLTGPMEEMPPVLPPRGGPYCDLSLSLRTRKEAKSSCISGTCHATRILLVCYLLCSTGHWGWNPPRLIPHFVLELALCSVTNDLK